jgi:hypothetical protein
MPVKVKGKKVTVSKYGPKKRKGKKGKAKRR